MAEIDPLKMASMISGGTALAGTAVGLVGNYFNKRATLKAIENLPDYEIPEEMKSYLALYKQRASSEMPGTEIAKESLQSQQAQTLNALRESGMGAGVLGAAAQSQMGTQMAFNDLAVRAAQYRAERQGELGQAYQAMAGYKDKAWEINTYNPAQMKMGVEANYRNAQLNTLMGGLNQAGTAGVNYFGQKAYGDMLKEMSPWEQQAKLQAQLDAQNAMKMQPLTPIGGGIPQNPLTLPFGQPTVPGYQYKPYDYTPSNGMNIVTPLG